MYNAHDPTEHRPLEFMVPAATKPRESPAEWLMRRLRKEYGLEFIFTDLSEEARKKVVRYARIWKDWEEIRRRKGRAK